MSEQTEPPQEIIMALAKFKADLLWDDIVGILDMVPAQTKQQLNDYYQNALLGAADKLQMPLESLKDQVEEIAYKKINGQTYSEVEVKARLKEYGVEA